MKRISNILKSRWPEDELMPASRMDEYSSGLENIIEIIKIYRLASWAFALFVGCLFRYIYAIVKKSILLEKIMSFLSALIVPFSEAQMHILTIAMNIIADFTSSLISAVICGGLLVYLFRKRATDLGIWSVGMFVLRNPLQNAPWLATGMNACLARRVIREA